MCGFTGILSSRLREPDPLRQWTRQMLDTIIHRGPDDSGIWTDPGRGLAFGFRRLAIVDRSVHGRQPMSSSSGRFTVVFNGEVFNHRALRTELHRFGHRFRGQSDTETILASFEAWGVEQ